MWGGIVSGRVTTLAAALETTADDLLRAKEEQDVSTMVDTLEPKGRGKDRDRPTDPEKRCLAFTTKALGDLRDAIEAEAPEAVPA